MTYAVYQNRGGSHDHILAVGESKDNLQERYNTWAADQRHQGLIPDGEYSVSFSGSTGGGAEFPPSCRVWIAEIEQRF